MLHVDAMQSAAHSHHPLISMACQAPRCVVSLIYPSLKDPREPCRLPRSDYRFNTFSTINNALLSRPDNVQPILDKHLQGPEEDGDDVGFQNHPQASDEQTLAGCWDFHD